jgi:hypothetical protein
LLFVAINSTGQFIISENVGIEGVPRMTIPLKLSEYISLVAVPVTKALNNVLPSVPAKAIFFMQWFLLEVVD